MLFEWNGARLYYETAGEGRPVLLLHGWGGRGERFLPLIRDLTPAHMVVSVDFPGHGNSPEPPEPWSVTEYMELIYALMKELRVEGADVVAHSFGGRVALLLASEHPEAARRLALTGCAGIPPRPSGKKSVKSRAYAVLKACCDNRLTRKMCSARVDAWREKLIQRFGSPDYRALTPSMRQTFNRVIQQDLTPCLDKIKAPTLLIWGTADTETPIWMGEEMERRIPDAALIRFEGAGHFAYLDRYPEFRAIVMKFLAD